MKRTRIVIADDHHVVRSGLQLLFKSSAEFSIVAEATNGDEAIALTNKHRPDVVILDISMPIINGIDATKHIKQQFPQTKILILTIHESEEYVYQMVRAGANGYVLKNAGKKELFEAVRAVVSGERFFSPNVSKLMIEEFIKRAQAHPALANASPLTKRENEILHLIAQGFTNTQIADKLFLSVRTVDTHRTNLMQKLDIHDTASLVRYAIQTGLIDVK